MRLCDSARLRAVTPTIPHVSSFDQMILANSAVRRLSAACFLGALIGIEREVSRKPAGIRTNVFICMACAFFTLLSQEIAGPGSPNRGQIAANIVQGIGFLGAGVILRNRFRIIGLTSAATVFVVASIGMACGAGLYIPATFATVIVITAMLLLGYAEHSLNLKTYPLIYELRGSGQETVVEGAVSVLDHYRRRLSILESGQLGSLSRIVFSASATRRVHALLLKDFSGIGGVEKVISYKEDDED